MLAGRNLVAPPGIDLQRCLLERELEHKNGLIPTTPSSRVVGRRWGMTLIGALSLVIVDYGIVSAKLLGFLVRKTANQARAW